jgi:hypothetical protein
LRDLCSEAQWDWRRGRERRRVMVDGKREGLQRIGCSLARVTFAKYVQAVVEVKSCWGSAVFVLLVLLVGDVGRLRGGGGMGLGGRCSMLSRTMSSCNKEGTWRALIRAE